MSVMFSFVEKKDTNSVEYQAINPLD